MVPEARARAVALVADDYRLICDLAGDLLRAHGYDVVACADGKKALSAYHPGRFSLLVLDVKMPHRTGVEVLREVRARGDTIPAVIMSSMMREQLETAVRNLGRVAVLVKPFGPEEFYTAVAQALRALTR